MRYFNIMVVTFLVADIRCHDNLSSIVDVQSLSVLPLEALLNIKKNLVNFGVEDIETNVTDELKSKEGDPQALPFIALDDIKKKGSYYVDYVLEDHSKYEKKKDVTKIFQLSITSLAFLAFGGYLLFLIIAAIKSKTYDYTYDPNATHFMSAIINAELNRRRRKKKRPIRGHGHFGYKENDPLEKSNKAKVKRAIISNARIDTEEMYRVLVNLCEGYSKIMGADNA